MSGQIGCGLKIRIAGQSLRAFQHHMAAGQLLGVEPEIAAARLAKGDPFVLAVVAANLYRQTGRCVQLQGLGPPLDRPSPPFLATPRWFALAALSQ